uniref:LisH domain-containing protein n=1 Tax=Trichogramma kaykai TaxID=54128 RepID=A0ABD2WU61_9HYME
MDQQMANAESLAEMTDVVEVLKLWEAEQNQTNYDPTPTLLRLAEIIEVETENYYKMDPDPFDERHPSRTDPDCNFGHILKVLFRKESFMTKLINDYLRDNYWIRNGIGNKDVRHLNTAACRLMLDILPGLETSAVFQPDMEGLILRMFSWAEKSTEPLQSYATGLLAAAMEVQDIATGFREQNGKMVPLMLKRLHKLQKQAADERQANVANRPFAHLGQNSSADSEHKTLSSKRKIRDKVNSKKKSPTELAGYSSEEEENAECESGDNSSHPVRKKFKNSEEDKESCEMMSPPLAIPPLHKFNSTPNKVQLSSPALTSSVPTSPAKNQNAETKSPASTPTKCQLSTPKSEKNGSFRYNYSSLLNNKNTGTPCSSLECNSNSSWAEMESYVIGSIQVYPASLATMQMLILRYLTPMGEYQEFLGHVFEQNALELIIKYINVRETKDSRLAFEALKYLASLLCHKKFSIEFLSIGGLQCLLDVPRPSVAATGVSICLYYLAYCEDAMEKVCLLPKQVIKELVTYALWLLERSHDSGRCHATMFFGFSFPFKKILDEFDNQDGLRKLYNVISTLPLLNVEEEQPLNDDEECASRQIVRHVAVALKKYMESHLYWKAETLQRAENMRIDRENTQSTFSTCKPCKLSAEGVQAKVELLQELMPMRAQWPPVDQLYRLGGIQLLLQIIAFAREWHFSSRVHTTSSAETVRACLDVIAICTVMPKAMLLLCDRIEVPDLSNAMSINLILAAAESEIVVDPDVQRAALRCVINCVCAPVNRIGGNVARFSVGGSTKKKTTGHSSEELIQLIWESFRSNNGIMVLLQLMMVKTPITDADSIRALACRALAGLARSETVRQIISKLPMFTDGTIQQLMKESILPEKRQEHVMFQKYAMELMERVSGKAKPTGAEYEISLHNLHRLNVVAQTDIRYDEQQVIQLINQYLMSKGFYKTASMLQKEEEELFKSQSYTPFTYRSTPLTTSPRPAISPALTLYTGSRTAQRDSTSRLSTTPTSNNRFIAHTPGSAPNATPCHSNNIRLKLVDSLTQSPASNGQPIKLQITQKKNTDKISTSVCPPPTSANNSQSACRLQKPISRDPGSNALTIASSKPNVTLDIIITEYLTNQHALCKNPMVTVPQFNLFEPHKCPDPCKKNSTPQNLTVRLARRQQGFDGMRLDRKYIYSRFCPVKTFRPAETDGSFTCCTFSQCQEYLLLGTYAGEVKMFNVRSGAEEASYSCHESYVSELETNRRGDLLLTSTGWGSMMSALWSLGTFFEMKIALDQEEHVEFSKFQDKIVGTQAEAATIYDLATGTLIKTLKPSISNNYSRNRATFSMNDELILSDGILWDVNSGKEIHKFDKLNESLNGIFHPNGLEVVSNTEVWDLRTYQLLKTVPALDQMDIKFSPVNSILYAISLDSEHEGDQHLVTSFKTVDALDYSNIATFDVKRGIYDLACNKFDSQIAVVENMGGDIDRIQESVVRLYDVGRKRDDEDEGEEDEDEDDLDASDDDDSNIASDNPDDGDNNGLQDDDNGDGNERGDDDSDDNNSDGDGSSGASDFERVFEALESDFDSENDGSYEFFYP